MRARELNEYKIIAYNNFTKETKYFYSVRNAAYKLDIPDIIIQRILDGKGEPFNNWKFYWYRP